MKTGIKVLNAFSAQNDKLVADVCDECDADWDSCKWCDWWDDTEMDCRQCDGYKRDQWDPRN